MNLIPNPSAAVDTAGWYERGGLDRATSTPWGFPEGVATAFRQDYSDRFDAVPIPISLADGADLVWSVWVACGLEDGADWYVAPAFEDADHNSIVTWYDVTLETDSPGWHLLNGTAAVPGGAAFLNFSVMPMSASLEPLYVTLATVEESSTPPEPVDASLVINGGAAVVFDLDVALGVYSGLRVATDMALKNDDTEGAEWTDWVPFAATYPWTLSPGGPGPRRVQARFRDEALDEWGEGLVFATTELVARARMGGQGVDVLDAEWDIAIKGGFGAATLDVIPPAGLSRFADSLNEALEVRDTNRHKLWEGRLEEPDLGYVRADRLTMDANGYVGYLDDDEYFRRCYVDSALGSWQTDQATKYADRFSVGIEDDDKLVMRVACYGGDPGQVLTGDMNCRAYWQLFDGIGTTQQITAFKFHYQGNLLDSNLRAMLYGRDTISSPSVNRLLWTSPNLYEPSGMVTLDASDIGDDVRVLVFKFGHFTGGD